jgi:hypothetical protein
MQDNEVYKKAEKRVREKIGFYFHFAAFVIVSAALFFIWYLTTPDGYPWFQWPILGWGIGILFHFVSTFVVTGKLKERMIEREMEKHK